MKIEIISKFFDNHSLSIVSRNLALELNKYYDVYLTSMDTYDPEQKLDKKILKQLKELLSKESIEEPDIQIRHTYPPVWRWPLSDKTKIIYIQPWEFSKTPIEWQQKWENFADALLVPSNWNKEIVVNAGLNPKKIFVIPNGYDPTVFNKEKAETNILDKDKFTFTFVGCGQFRKGVDILLNAWSRAFAKADNVQLLIKDTPIIYGENNLLNEIIRMQYKTKCGTAIYNSDNLSQEEMANIYKNSHIIVHPYRGEGFGMHVQEAMACGAVPIITFGGACNDFTDESNSLYLTTSRKFIDITKPEVVAMKPGDSFSGMGSHSWVLEPDPNDIINKMQYLYYHHEREKTLSDLQKNLDKKLNTWNMVGKKLKPILEYINQNVTKSQRFR